MLEEIVLEVNRAMQVIANYFNDSVHCNEMQLVFMLD